MMILWPPTLEVAKVSESQKNKLIFCLDSAWGAGWEKQIDESTLTILAGAG